MAIWPIWTFQSEFLSLFANKQSYDFDVFGGNFRLAIKQKRILSIFMEILPIISQSVCSIVFLIFIFLEMLSSIWFKISTLVQSYNFLSAQILTIANCLHCHSSECRTCNANTYCSFMLNLEIKCLQQPICLLVYITKCK